MDGSVGRVGFCGCIFRFDGSSIDRFASLTDRLPDISTNSSPRWGRVGLGETACFGLVDLRLIYLLR